MTKTKDFLTKIKILKRAVEVKEQFKDMSSNQKMKVPVHVTKYHINGNPNLKSQFFNKTDASLYIRLTLESKWKKTKRERRLYQRRFPWATGYTSFPGFYKKLYRCRVITSGTGQIVTAFPC